MGDKKGSKEIQTSDRLLKGICKFIEPAKAQKTAASRSYQWLRKKLKTGKMSARCLDIFLIGSYARKTAIHPIDDVDIIVIIDPKSWEIPFLAGYPDPDKVLESIQRAVKYRYAESGVRRQNRSVGLKMSHLGIDVVPAIKTKEEDVLLIPDRSTKEWIKTAPEKHNRIVSKLNKETSGLFIPLVKLLKHWNSGLPAAAQLKSFCIETMSARIFSEHSLTSLTDGLIRFFDFMVYASSGFLTPRATYHWKSDLGINLRLFNPTVPDMVGLNTNTLGNTEWERRKKFVDKALQSRDWLLSMQSNPTVSNTKHQIQKVMKVEIKSVEIA